MTLNKPVKILVGLGTLWFTVYPLLFIAVWLFSFVGMGFFSFGAASSNAGPESMPFFMFPFLLIFPIHFCTIFLGFILMAFYLIHVIKNTKADETVRIILGIGTFFMPFIAMPIYYYAYIWLDEPPVWAAAKPKL